MPKACKFTYTGLKELGLELAQLPQAVRREGNAIESAAAHGAADELRSVYGRIGPAKGGLAKKYGQTIAGAVTVEAVSTGYFLYIKHPPGVWALWYEVGTQSRHTKLGYNRGRMPAAHVFYPTVTRHERQMWAALVAMVQKHGLRVVGLDPRVGRAA